MRWRRRELPVPLFRASIIASCIGVLALGIPDRVLGHVARRLDAETKVGGVSDQESYVHVRGKLTVKDRATSGIAPLIRCDIVVVVEGVGTGKDSVVTSAPLGGTAPERWKISIFKEEGEDAGTATSRVKHCHI